MSSHHVPIIWLGGEAGSGKDTVGSYLQGGYDAICVAQADPMKRFTAEVFGFTPEQLWGPSENRNAVDEHLVDDKLKVSKAFRDYLSKYPNELVDLVVPKEAHEQAYRDLDNWFELLYLGLENGLPVSPRYVLQTLGTEWGRHLSKDMWSRYAIETCRKLLCGGFTYNKAVGLVKADDFPGFNFAVITDGRFRNECLNVRMAGGVALKIVRNTDRSVVDAAGVKGHVSERELGGIPNHFFNDIIQNHSSLQVLAGRLDSLIRYYFGV